MNMTTGPESLPYIPTQGMTSTNISQHDLAQQCTNITTGYHQLPSQSYSYGKSATLPRPPKAKFIEGKMMTNLQVSYIQMKRICSVISHNYLDPRRQGSSSSERSERKQPY